MSPLSTPSQQGYHVQTVKPLTFILQLPNSSVRCNCASHQPELGLLRVRSSGERSHTALRLKSQSCESVIQIQIQTSMFVKYQDDVISQGAVNTPVLLSYLNNCCNRVTCLFYLFPIRGVESYRIFNGGFLF